MFPRLYQGRAGCASARSPVGCVLPRPQAHGGLSNQNHASDREFDCLGVREERELGEGIQSCDLGFPGFSAPNTAGTISAPNTEDTWKHLSPLSRSCLKLWRECAAVERDARIPQLLRVRLGPTTTTAIVRNLPKEEMSWIYHGHVHDRCQVGCKEPVVSRISDV